ncbi:MAG: hypothetical protein O3A63_00010 [Proteobacteria bacterium]|nr:hypothetical protein [Pseudomonadota bacterium]
MISIRICTQIGLVLLVASTLAVAPATAGEHKRTAAGRPDLSGTYDAATLTPLQRPTAYGENLYLTQEEAEKIATEERTRMAASGSVSNPERDAPPDGGDGSQGASGNVGGYNTFWIDRGTDAFTVEGKFRTSIIIDPVNGRMPPMTPQAQANQASQFAEFARGNDGTAWWLNEKGEGEGPFDNMEQRNSAERCLLGFTGVAPVLPSLYNNFKRIVQTEDHVMILIEMVHDARIVRMNSEHLPAHVTKWLGDSIGWWEGDTLVVDTTNFRPETSRRGSPETNHVVERFSLTEQGDVLYSFTVENPGVWTAPWTGEYVWRSSDEQVFEYACHEGNYALGNIMRGARLLEQDIISTVGAGGQE